ncbi:FkbM family methyltransferase [Methylocystis heyeri]|uniref:FkbM family methyltransferase n=1 Tax=Methylocystis heyeri TaxID=391905 RepID=A0A6B8KJN3_9HYPH|nr:FkbM family methyltransferase [Methylocystis heyeri]QGM47135.1 FkbM family methyltransferase [Methylocystis heyeri]
MFTSVKELVKSAPPLYRALNRWRKLRLHDPDTCRNVSLLGSDYGGWGVDVGLLTPDSIAYSIGVGEDITFDLDLIDRTGCTVYGFDPTPGAVRWLASQQLPDRYHFVPIGIGVEDGAIDFSVPENPLTCSCTALDSSTQKSSNKVSCEVQTLASLQRRLGHTHIDLLKMDIEGLEYAVLDNIFESGSRPRQLLIEFHHLMYSLPVTPTIAAVEKLRGLGYGLYWVSDLGREYAFVDLHHLES